jgi:hypothetical protein
VRILIEGEAKFGQRAGWLGPPLCLLLATALGACAALDPGQQYAQAIASAAVAAPDKLHGLLAVPATPYVSVVTWVSEAKRPCGPDRRQCHSAAPQDPGNRVWVTMAGEVQEKCRSWGLQGDPLRRRLEQVLGLPPDPPAQYRKTEFAVIDVPRSALARPCLGVDGTDPKHPTCTINVPKPSATVAPSRRDMLDFVGGQMETSYFTGSGAPGYPFTRLGYTYDWGDAWQQGHYGASEFVLAPGTGMQVRDTVPTDAYCSR